MILFFDTETTGLPNFDEKARHPSQPHMVQLAAILTEDDGTLLEKFCVLIKPKGWVIPPEVIAVHGITNEMAATGMDEAVAARKLLELIRKASLIVAFNVMFDKFIARIAMRRYELITDENDAWWKGLPTYCPMRKMTDICQLPNANGRGGKFKFPKLQEAYQHAFGRPFDKAHDAIADVTATMQLYFWLQLNGGGK